MGAGPAFFSGVFYAKGIGKCNLAVLFLVYVCRCVWVQVNGYESQWEFSKHGIPVPVLSNDGSTYGMERQLIRSIALNRSNREKVNAGGLILFGSIIFLLFLDFCRYCGDEDIKA